ncbi:MAG: ABC transporter ATP-binding protein [Ilumatobacteraceae bacterium]|nr:ABC transporter ATP-binding protein [Ilumatobacteraceae bacterium]
MNHDSIDGGPSAASLLAVDEVCTDFTTERGQLRAVDGVSLRVSVGETLGIVGESGSGKSVLMRTIMGLLPRHGVTVAGQAVFDGQDLLGSRRTTRRLWGTEIAMVFQDPMTSLNPTKRVGQHITESLRYHLRLGRRDAQREAISLLDQVGIPDAARRVDQYPHELSGGMRQRVTIAVAIACRPRLLIADEPTTALDVTVQQQILELLGRLQAERGMAMILVTHDLGVVAGRTDRVAVMYSGRIIETAETAATFADVRHPYTEGLLASIPRITDASQKALDALPGRPPDLVALPDGCRFEPRCSYATQRCGEVDPPLESDPHGHAVACWHPRGNAPQPHVDTDSGRA